MPRKITLAIVTSLAAAFAAVGHAAATPENDALGAADAGISLTQAIASAEQYAHGRAAQASFENSAVGAVYTVEVVSRQQVFDVTVAANDGRILASKADHEDRSDNEERADRD